MNLREKTGDMSEESSKGPSQPSQFPGPAFSSRWAAIVLIVLALAAMMVLIGIGGGSPSPPAPGSPAIAWHSEFQAGLALAEKD